MLEGGKDGMRETRRESRMGKWNTGEGERIVAERARILVRFTLPMLDTIPTLAVSRDALHLF